MVGKSRLSGFIGGDKGRLGGLWSWLSSRRRETDRDCWRYDRDSMEIRWRRAEFVEFVEFVELLEFMEIRDCWRSVEINRRYVRDY
jgi:hypothetical protein